MKAVLIIDDDQSYVEIMTDALSGSYRVLKAPNGRQGLAVARTEHPDLILLDIRMPIMDGLAALDELRKDAYGKSAKVVLLTNLEPEDKIISQVTKDPSTHYFIKSDIQLDSFLRKIDGILAS